MTEPLKTKIQGKVTHVSLTSTTLPGLRCTISIQREDGSMIEGTLPRAFIRDALKKALEGKRVELEALAEGPSFLYPAKFSLAGESQ